MTFDTPDGLHAATADLVARFASALAHKLHKAEVKHGYTDGWLQKDWQLECSIKLIDHLTKGDPRDVAAYCAFMWHHGWATSLEVHAHAAPKRPTMRDPLIYREPSGGAVGVYYVHRNCGDKVFVKEGAFFEQQGGLTEEWGKAWTLIEADSIEHARALGDLKLPRT